MTGAAHLRVYLPEQRVEAPLEHVTENVTTAKVITSGEYGVWRESVRDDAFVIEVDGGRFVCPRHPRLRMLEGLLAFRNAYDGPTGTVLVPEGVAERAARELARIHARFPDARSHILTSPFFVPLRWFAAFDPAERELVEEADEISIRYRTRLHDGIGRLRRAVDVLEGAGFDEVITDPVSDLVRWVEGFPGDALLELDYGGVADLFTSAELALDESAADVGASLDALVADDFEMAGEHYAAAASRWAHAQSLAYAN